ncbi:hypothetical protein [Longimicrobium sp.]|uniref:hypothetical protein n=1 Tax=Longimicrobium sp. TaxID=2029185 RepID=UPI002ED7DD7F
MQTGRPILSSVTRRIVSKSYPEAAGVAMLPDRYVSIPRLREAAQARADATSGRAVAREVDISHRGLMLFLEGARPQPKTLEKLLAWYHEHVQRSEGPPISASDALLVLMRAIPPEHRPAAASTLLSSLQDVHRAAGVECPPDVIAAGTSGT